MQGITRRQLIAATSGIIGGAALATTASQPAQAQQNIEWGTLTIPDKTAYGETVDSVNVSVDIQNEWESTGGQELDLTLSAGYSEESQYDVDTQTLEISENGSQTVSLSGDLLATPAYDVSMVDPAIGASIDPVFVVTSKLKSAEETLDTTSISTRATINFEEGQVQGTLNLKATGNITVA